MRLTRGTLIPKVKVTTDSEEEAMTTIDRRGIAPYCESCLMRKKPLGRSAPAAMANGLCDQDCEGYRDEPRPDDLWPGESASEFGYGREAY